MFYLYAISHMTLFNRNGKNVFYFDFFLVYLVKLLYLLSQLYFKIYNLILCEYLRTGYNKYCLIFRYKYFSIKNYILNHIHFKEFPHFIH